jgi:hypothetical protein
MILDIVEHRLSQEAIACGDVSSMSDAHVYLPAKD